MSRRIGNYYDEKTGDTHWLEPDTVKDYALPLGRIAMQGHNGYKTVTYQLTSNEKDKTIVLVASMEHSISGNNNLNIESERISMDEMRFADILFDSYAKDQTFVTRDEIKEFTGVALKSLAKAAFNHSCILDGLELDNGFGSIYYEDDRVATFDGISVYVDPYEKNITFSLVNVVSQATILTDKEPAIQYKCGNKEIFIRDVEITESTEGLVRQYQITSSNISITEGTQVIPKLEHQYTDDVTPESPYIAERVALLSSAEIEEEDFEDRFEDIFSL